MRTTGNGRLQRLSNHQLLDVPETSKPDLGANHWFEARQIDSAPISSDAIGVAFLLRDNCTQEAFWKSVSTCHVRAWSPSDGGVTTTSTVRQPRKSAGLRVPAQEAQALPSAMPGVYAADTARPTHLFLGPGNKTCSPGFSRSDHGPTSGIWNLGSCDITVLGMIS